MTTRTMTPILTGEAVTEALRSAHARKDIEKMRLICANTPDEVLLAIGKGDLEIRGDSRKGFEVYTIDREYLWPTPFKGERHEGDRIDVTGKTENTIERVERGMLRQMDTDRFYLDRVSVPGEPYDYEAG